MWGYLFGESQLTVRNRLSVSEKQFGSWRLFFCLVVVVFLFFFVFKNGKKVKVESYCLGAHVLLLLCARHQPSPWAHLMHSCVTANCEPLQWVIFFRMKCDIVWWCWMYGPGICKCVCVYLYSTVAPPVLFMLNISGGLWLIWVI